MESEGNLWRNLGFAIILVFSTLTPFPSEVIARDHPTRQNHRRPDGGGSEKRRENRLGRSFEKQNLTKFYRINELTLSFIPTANGSDSAKARSVLSTKENTSVSTSPSRRS